MALLRLRLEAMATAPLGEGSGCLGSAIMATARCVVATLTPPAPLMRPPTRLGLSPALPLLASTNGSILCLAGCSGP